ncbi:MAG: VWA domain-containing protein [Deltaproteobacteria bacterium]|nr:MAG: VWA domain-containing protein [Deltaproteobacteria bacterium]
MKKLLAFCLLSVSLLLSGCPDTTTHSQGVYMLLDSSGTYRMEVKKAQAIINYLLGRLQPGDSLAVARVDSASFSEKDIIAKMTFDRRPSVTNQQKRLFKQKIDGFFATVKGSAFTDITGGVLQAVEYLNETGSGKKFILIFSDLKEELAKGHVRDFPIELSGCRVVALNVTKLRSDNIDPREYYKRVEGWQARVQAGGGHWRVINDLERLDTILAE